MALPKLNNFELTLIDGDLIQRSNLNRQFLFSEIELNQSKSKLLAAKLKKLSNISIHFIPKFLNEDEASEVIERSSYVVDATDSVRNKFLLNDLAMKFGKPYGYAGVIGTQGVFLESRKDNACLRCVFGDLSADEINSEQQSCQTAGIIGAVCGMFGSLLASGIERFLTNSPAPQELVSFKLDRGLRISKVKRNSKCWCHQ